ncbi:MAG: hypothetical protein QXV17_14895 [Candidatus Micrarchaeaceae archaeon]
MAKKINKNEKFKNFAKQQIQKNPSISASQIIEKAKKRKIGIRRQNALAIIRDLKGVKPKVNRNIHIPKKYRKREITYTQPEYEHPIYVYQARIYILTDRGDEYWIAGYLRYTPEEARISALSEYDKSVESGHWNGNNVYKAEMITYVHNKNNLKERKVYSRAVML